MEIQELQTWPDRHSLSRQNNPPWEKKMVASPQCLASLTQPTRHKVSQFFFTKFVPVLWTSSSLSLKISWCFYMFLWMMLRFLCAKCTSHHIVSYSRGDQNTGHRLLFYQYWNNPNPFLLQTLGLSSTQRQCIRPKYYTKTMFRLKVSISKGLRLFQYW